MRQAASVLALILLPAVAEAADLTWECRHLQVTLGPDAAWKSVLDKQTRKDYCPPGKPVRIAAVQIAGKSHEADRASLDGGRLTIGFAHCDTRLTYTVRGTIRPCCLALWICP